LIIDRIHVKNFRSIADETIKLDSLTALVGPNGAGKSSFLRAFEIFYSEKQRVFPGDFHNKNTSSPIEITVTFKILSISAKKLFQKYIGSNDLMGVTNIISWEGSGTSSKYVGSKLRRSDFSSCREALSLKDRGATARKIYSHLKSSAEFDSLPDVSKKEQIEESLEIWELNNSEKCERLLDDGKFFGFSGVAKGYIGRYTKLVSIPAIHDASGEASEKRSSAISNLMDLVVRKLIQDSDEVRSLQTEVKQKYADLIEKQGFDKLAYLQSELTSILKSYVKSADVRLDWQETPDISLPVPHAEVKLGEDGYQTEITRTGHGLQRAFIISLFQKLAELQHNSKLQPEESQDIFLPNVILLIEEPELYQHPNRQRFFSKLLLELASDQKNGNFNQIFYCTHEIFQNVVDCQPRYWQPPDENP